MSFIFEVGLGAILHLFIITDHRGQRPKLTPGQKMTQDIYWGHPIVCDMIYHPNNSTHVVGIEARVPKPLFSVQCWNDHGTAPRGEKLMGVSFLRFGIYFTLVHFHWPLRPEAIVDPWTKSDPGHILRSSHYMWHVFPPKNSNHVVGIEARVVVICWYSEQWLNDSWCYTWILKIHHWCCL